MTFKRPVQAIRNRQVLRARRDVVDLQLCVEFSSRNGPTTGGDQNVAGEEGPVRQHERRVGDDAEGSGIGLSGVKADQHRVRRVGHIEGEELLLRVGIGDVARPRPVSDEQGLPDESGIVDAGRTRGTVEGAL